MSRYRPDTCCGCSHAGRSAQQHSATLIFTDVLAESPVNYCSSRAFGTSGWWRDAGDPRPDTREDRSAGWRLTRDRQPALSASPPRLDSLEGTSRADLGLRKVGPPSEVARRRVAPRCGARRSWQQSRAAGRSATQIVQLTCTDQFLDAPTAPRPSRRLTCSTTWLRGGPRRLECAILTHLLQPCSRLPAQVSRRHRFQLGGSGPWPCSTFAGRLPPQPVQATPISACCRHRCR